MEEVNRSNIITGYRKIGNTALLPGLSQIDFILFFKSLSDVPLLLLI